MIDTDLCYDFAINSIKGLPATVALRGEVEGGSIVSNLCIGDPGRSSTSNIPKCNLTSRMDLFPKNWAGFLGLGLIVSVRQLVRWQQLRPLSPVLVPITPHMYTWSRTCLSALEILSMSFRLCLACPSVLEHIIAFSGLTLLSNKERHRSQ